MCTGVFFLLLTWRHTLPNSPASPSPWNRLPQNEQGSLSPMLQIFAQNCTPFLPVPPPQLQLSRHPFFPLFFSIAHSSATNALCFINLLCLFRLYSTRDVNFVRVGFFVKHIHKRTNKRTNKPPPPPFGSLISCLQNNEPLTVFQSTLLAIRFAHY